jgi:hexosaminidase
MSCIAKCLCAAGLFCLAGVGAFAATTSESAIIPLPTIIELHEGAFALHTAPGAPGQDAGATIIAVDPAAAETGRFLANELRRATGGEFPVAPTTGKKPARGQIRLTLKGADAGLGDEGYTLSTGPEGVVIRARGQAGLFYGAQSLLQLVPPDARGSAVEIPGVDIRDQPRFKWRGLMLDVSRHFFSKAEVEQLLDAMARYKLNRFHWHLVDDQGWRIEIKKYPRLTETGAWRQSIGFGLDAKSSTAYGADGRYGGYYTQDDIREVVAYARKRHIMIIPEIEMPGHSSAALMVHPELSCTGGPFTTDLPGGVFNGIYCVGNDASYAFVQDVLAEVFDLFPGPYIHIGGDEVPTNNWRNCPKCQTRMKEEGLTKEIELESYFIRRVEKFVNAHHRNLIGWSEIREGGLAENAAIMDWVGGATEAATAGHDVVMCPLADCYFDHYQSRNHATEPRSIGGYLPLSQVYAFEPVPADLDSRYQSHILGAQANVWTEYMPSLKHVEYMVFPRLCALSEVVWSPRQSRNWQDFSRRLQFHYVRLERLGITYRRDTGSPGQVGSAK